MINKFLILSFYLLCLWPDILCAQQTKADTTLNLEGVTISASRNSLYANGIRSESIPTGNQQSPAYMQLGQALSDQGTVFVRAYGVASLASLSLRGGSANHTAVTWHGFNINSPMNGITDLALIPAGVSTDATLHYGGTSSLWGGSAIGGQLALGKKPAFGQGLTSSVAVTAGSFGHQSQGVDISFGSSTVSSRLGAYHVSADNDYSYTPLMGTSKVKLPNASVNMTCIVTENHFRLSQGQKAGIHVWLQRADRNIPPALWDDDSKSNQKDFNTRIVSEYSLSKLHANWLLRGSYMQENQNYKNPSWGLDDHNSYRQWAAESEVRPVIKGGHKANLGANYTYVTASSPYYSEEKTRENFAIFGSYSFRPARERWKAGINLRQEWTGRTGNPFVYSLGGEYILSEKWLIMANAGRVYRNPTLNELYWSSGGNPSLKPEDGYTADLSATFDNKKVSQNKWNIVSCFFYKNIHNWINWSPDSSGNWQPRNLNRVVSYGYEFRAGYLTLIAKAKAGIDMNATLLSSKTTESAIPVDVSLDKSLVYVPALTSMVRIYGVMRGISLAARYNYTSKRYTAVDNTAYLPAFGLLSLRAGYSTSLQKLGIEAFCDLNNLTNLSYTVVDGWPMPGRNFTAGLKLRLK